MKIIFISALFFVIAGLFAGCGRVETTPPVVVEPAAPEEPVRPAHRPRRYLWIDTAAVDMVWDSYAIVNMTEPQLLGLIIGLEHIDYPRRLIPDLHTPELFSVPLYSEFLLNHLDSFSSKESARRAAITLSKRMSGSSFPSYSYEFIGENDYFYQFRVIAYTNHWSTTTRVVLFKDSAITLYTEARTRPRGTPAIHNAIIHNTDAQNVLNVLDFFLYFHIDLGFTDDIQHIYRELHETEDCLQYLFYTVQRDRGVSEATGQHPDTISLIRTVLTVDRTTGTVSQTAQDVLKEIRGHHQWGMFVVRAFL